MLDRPASMKVPSLNAALEIGDPVVAYSGLAARALDDDPVASIMLCQLWYWTRGGTRTSSVTGEQIFAVTGITERRQRRARVVLVKRGWLAERARRVDGRTHNTYALMRDRIIDDLRQFKHANLQPGDVSFFGMHDVPHDETSVGRMTFSSKPDDETSPSKNSNQDSEKKERTVSPVWTAAELLAGCADGLAVTDKIRLVGCVLEELSRQWHAGQRVLVATKVRVELWRDFVRAGGLPSDAMKAIAGMRHDDWDKRGELCDLKHVLGACERWVRLFEEKHARGATPRWPRSNTIPTGMRKWKDIVVDAAEKMGHADDQQHAAGYVYVIDDRAWVDPLDDPRGRIVAHRAKYGETNITEQARARIEAAAAKAAREASERVNE